IAVIQVVALRSGLHFAPRTRGLVGGAIAGTVTALLLGAGAMARVPELARHPVITLLVAAYIGAPVGVFLSYFRRDDARIEAAAAAQGPPAHHRRGAHRLGSL